MNVAYYDKSQLQLLRARWMNFQKEIVFGYTFMGFQVSGNGSHELEVAQQENAYHQKKWCRMY